MNKHPEKTTSQNDLDEISLQGIQVKNLYFTRMVLPLGWQKPFAVIRYVDENNVEHGLRFDTGKRAFLDHFEEGSKQHAILLSAVDHILIRYRQYIRSKSINLLRNQPL